MRFKVVGFFSGALLAATAYGQSMISAHSGVVQYVEGNVSIADKPVELKFGHFPDVKPNEIIKTEEGRAEVLLSPGSFLRLAENTEVRMVSNHLSDTRFELVKGEILVECVDATKDKAAAMVKGNVIAVIYKDTTTTLVKSGLYEFKADPGRLRVFEGEAAVKSDSGLLTLKRGKETELQAALMAEKFDPKAGDELTRWSSRRSSYVATANMSSANTMATSGGNWSSAFLGSSMGYGSGYGSGIGSGYGGFGGGWAWNPMFGMFTYMPFGGIGYSPFGYSYFSPYSYSQYYLPYYGGGGYYRGNTGGNSALAGGSSIHSPIASTVASTRSSAAAMPGIRSSGVSSANSGVSSSGGFSRSSAASASAGRSSSAGRR